MTDVIMREISDAEELLTGSRPIGVNANTGAVLVNSARGFQVNSLLKEDEWRAIDQAVMEAARPPLRMLGAVRGAGLTSRIGSLGTMVSQWYTRSEMTAASVSMSGRTTERDLPDMKMSGVPVPIFAKEFAIDLRTLLASRRLGDGLDVTTAQEAARVVAEAMDNMVLNGATGVVVNGATIYGLRNHPDINTDTAANYGGGDWGTSTYPVKTVAGMVNAANNDYHYGPFNVFVAQTQYNQAAQTFYTDGSGDTELARILRLPLVNSVTMIPQLPDGNVLLVDMTRETLDWAEVFDVQTREWATPDGMTSIFRVMAAGVIRVKSRYGGQSGIVLATSA